MVLRTSKNPNYKHEGTHYKFTDGYRIEFWKFQESVLEGRVFSKHGTYRGKYSLGPIEYQPQFKQFSKKAKCIINRFMKECNFRRLKKGKAKPISEPQKVVLVRNSRFSGPGPDLQRDIDSMQAQTF